MDKMKFDPGNPQEEAPKRIQPKNKKKKWLRLAVVTAIVLAIVALAVLWDSTTFDGLRRSFVYARADKDENGCARLYSYDSDRSGCFATLDGSLIRSSLSQVSVMGEDGNMRFHESVKFRCAAIDSNGKRAVAYDIGGTELYVLDSKGLVHHITCDSEVQSAQLGEDNKLAVVVNKSGYKAAVYVYDAAGQLTFEFDSADKFIMAAAVSDDGKHLAAVTMGQSDGVFTSYVVIYRMNRKEPTATCELPGEAVYDLRTVDNTFCVVAENALYFVANNGTINASYPFEESYLRRCSLQGDGFAALLLGRYKSGAQGTLLTVDERGKVIGQVEADGEVLDLSASGNYVAALYSDHLTIYDKRMRECATLSNVSAAREILMRDDGSAVLAGNGSAALYLP